MTGLLRDQRGTATLEYLILLIYLTIGMATALYLIGPGLVEVFRARVLWLALPIP